MSRTSSADARGGFTLIETMAVMLIIALVASIIVPMTRGTGRGQLKAVALETADLLRRERVGAVLTRRLRHVSIDGEQRVLIGDGGRTVAIPKDVALDVMGVNETWAGRRSLVRFETDGSSSGTIIKLARDGFGYEIRVNWYTGGVTLVEP
jgi:general secretion pathway protein H